MLDLYAEFHSVVKALETAGVGYALCGGLAVSIYTRPRATVDIDFMIMGRDFEMCRGVLRGLGFDIESKPMEFAGGKVTIRRLTKVEKGGDDHLVVDVVESDKEPLKRIFDSRLRMEWEGLTLWVVSREGLVELKGLRGSAQDVADIENLERPS